MGSYFVIHPSKGVVLECHKCRIRVCLGPSLRSMDNIRSLLDEFEELHPDTKRRRHRRTKYFPAGWHNRVQPLTEKPRERPWETAAI